MTTIDEKRARPRPTVAVAARIDADTAAELRQRADAGGLTMSDVVASCIRLTLTEQHRVEAER